jgi:hypothetical protein
MLDNDELTKDGSKIRLARFLCKDSKKLCSWYNNEHDGGGAEHFVGIMYPAFRLYTEDKKLNYMNPSYAVQSLQQFATMGMKAAEFSRESRVKNDEKKATTKNPGSAVKIMTTGNYEEMFNDVTSNTGAQMAVFYTGPDYTRDDDSKLEAFEAQAVAAQVTAEADEAAGLPALSFAKIDCNIHPKPCALVSVGSYGGISIFNDNTICGFKVGAAKSGAGYRGESEVRVPAGGKTAGPDTFDHEFATGSPTTHYCTGSREDNDSTTCSIHIKL